MSIVLFFCLALCAPAHAAESVAIVSLSFKGDISEGLRQTVRQKLDAGLAATGATVLPAEKIRAAIGSQPCDGRDCWRKLWVKLGCRWVVGASVEGEDRSYTISLWLSDGRSGKVLARTDDRCDICGLRAMADKMDLTASALRAKLEQAAKQPARLLVTADEPGAVISVDGKEVGPAPRELVLTAGQYEVTAKLDGFLTAARRIRTISGVQDKLALRLLKAPRPPSPLRTAGWISAGTGVAALGAGIALLAIDGSGIDCDAADEMAGGQCRRQWNTSGGGATLSVLGTAALLGGGYLLYRTFFGKRSGKKTSARPSSHAWLPSYSR